MKLFPTGIPVIKRLFDLILTVIGLILALPFLLLIALLVFIVEGLPILFCQDRPGLGGEIFKLCKFRTMRNLHSQTGELLPDEQRISPLGSFLRRTSLDELPELINIFKGDMSLVGPRPLLTVYLQRYTPEQARRHEVLPGITGWAQVNGRNALTWKKKFELDVWYVNHWSIWLDVKILFITLWKVITGEGISQPGRVTADEFTGNQK